MNISVNTTEDGCRFDAERHGQHMMTLRRQPPLAAR